MLQDDKITISTVRRQRNYETNPHFHRHNEIYYLEEGSSKIFVDTKLYNLSAGSLVFIRSGRIHRTVAGDNTSHKRTVLMFPDSIVKKLFDICDDSQALKNIDSMVVHIPEIVRNQLKTKFSNIHKEVTSPDSMSDSVLKSIINQILIDMLRTYKNKSHVARDSDNILNEVIQQAINFICKNYNRQITLNMTADYINMSPTYFSKKFKRETGFGFKEYLAKYRLREAVKLRKSNKYSSITDVATRCGFNDSNYFATAFKAEYGVSPNKFRHYSDV